ncbi:MAG TPA: OmpA family protein [Rhizomicrobium sp.]|nr:OmpA family protein [Rhizomicrobium sp.]
MRTGITRHIVGLGARLGVVAVLAVGLSGCQTIADLDPTGLLAEETPDLADIPNAPAVPDTERDVASSLSAAGVQAQYSADALRAGTEAVAPAPGAAAPMSPQVAQALAAPPSSDAPPSASAVAPAAAPVSAPITTNDAPPSASAVPPTAAAPIPVQGNAASAAPPIAVSGNAAPAVQMASAAPSRPFAPPPGAEPAVPAVPPAGAIRSTIMAQAPVSDAALGFKPSTAPALDASVSNFVSAPILSRYRQTAARTGGTAVAAVPGGASGSVVTNLDAQPTSAVAAIAARNGGVAPNAVVYFPGDGVALSAAARTQVRAAAAAFKAAGGTGTIRVVGHASSRTPNMSVERHLRVIFEKSQGRANAVARELMNQGVPADRVRIDAVGDSQPVYYESMPRGEEGNRRAEIYVQS